jgi:integrase/recombinase XerD
MSMKSEEIKIKLGEFGVKVKSKERSSGKYYLIKFTELKDLEDRLSAITKSKIEKTDKGIFILKNKETLQQLLVSFSKQNKPQKPLLKKDDHAILIKSFSEKAQKKYSPRTIKNYRNHLLAFLRNINQRQLLDFTSKDLEKYLIQRSKSKVYSVSDTNMHINAIRFFFENVLQKREVVVHVDRPKQPGKLKILLDDTSLQTLLQQTPNLKHRIVILFAFKFGIKTSKIVSLRRSEIEILKNEIHINIVNSKQNFKKEISKFDQQILSSYLEVFAPKKFFFEGALPGKPITMRAIQKILLEGKIKSGVKKFKKAIRKKK